MAVSSAVAVAACSTGRSATRLSALTKTPIFRQPSQVIHTAINRVSSKPCRRTRKPVRWNARCPHHRSRAIVPCPHHLTRKVTMAELVHTTHTAVGIIAAWLSNSTSPIHQRASWCRLARLGSMLHVCPHRLSSSSDKPKCIPVASIAVLCCMNKNRNTGHT